MLDKMQVFNCGGLFLYKIVLCIIYTRIEKVLTPIYISGPLLDRTFSPRGGKNTKTIIQICIGTSSKSYSEIPGYYVRQSVPLSPADQHQMNALDKTLVDGMQHAEKKCRKLRMGEWANLTSLLNYRRQKTEFLCGN